MKSFTAFSQKINVIFWLTEETMKKSKNERIYFFMKKLICIFWSIITIILFLTINPVFVYADSINPYVGKYVTSYFYDTSERDHEVHVGEIWHDDHILTKDDAYVEIYEDFTCLFYFDGEEYNSSCFFDDGELVCEDEFFVVISEDVLRIDAAYGWICVKENQNADVHMTSNSHSHEWTEGVIFSATQHEDGLEGVYCKFCGAIKESHPISAYGYALNTYAMSMINQAKPGQTVTFELGEWNSFPKAFMEKIAAKSLEGVSFVFHYKWNHEKQEITIPYGTIVDTSLDWYGPAKMAELYGAN